MKKASQKAHEHVQWTAQRDRKPGGEKTLLGNLRNKKATTNQYNFSISRFGTKLEKYIKYKDFLPVPSPVQELFKERRLFFFISV